MRAGWQAVLRLTDCSSGCSATCPGCGSRDYSGIPMKNTKPEKWYLRIDGDTYGPFTRIRILDLASQGRVPVSATVRRKGDRTWVPAAQLVGATKLAKASWLPWEVRTLARRVQVKKRVQVALCVIAASPFFGVFAGPAVGFGVFESYMFGPLCGFLLAGAGCWDLLVRGGQDGPRLASQFAPKPFS